MNPDVSLNIILWCIDGTGYIFNLKITYLMHIFTKILSKCLLLPIIDNQNCAKQNNEYEIKGALANLIKDQTDEKTQKQTVQKENFIIEMVRL